MSDFMIKDFGPLGAHDRTADDGRPARYAVVALVGMFPGRILANPDGGNCYYAEKAQAEAALAKVRDSFENGRPV